MKKKKFIGPFAGGEVHPKRPNFFSQLRRKGRGQWPSPWSRDLGLKKEFQSCIGAFWWLAQISRPDIFFAVHRCSKLVNVPTPRLGLRIMKIINYLEQTPSVGIVYQRHKAPSLLSGFVDAAFASEENFASRLGYFFLLRGNLISWASENPSRQMTSSTEVECRRLLQISKENVWHRQFHEV